jgi:hypothetical protein
MNSYEDYSGEVFPPYFITGSSPYTDDQNSMKSGDFGPSFYTTPPRILNQRDYYNKMAGYDSRPNQRQPFATQQPNFTMMNDRYSMDTPDDYYTSGQNINDFKNPYATGNAYRAGVSSGYYGGNTGRVPNERSFNEKSFNGDYNPSRSQYSNAASNDMMMGGERMGGRMSGGYDPNSYDNYLSDTSSSSLGGYNDSRSEEYGYNRSSQNQMSTNHPKYYDPYDPYDDHRERGTYKQNFIRDNGLSHYQNKAMAPSALENISVYDSGFGNSPYDGMQPGSSFNNGMESGMPYDGMEPGVSFDVEGFEPSFKKKPFKKVIKNKFLEDKLDSINDNMLLLLLLIIIVTVVCIMQSIYIYRLRNDRPKVTQ